MLLLQIYNIIFMYITFEYTIFYLCDWSIASEKSCYQAIYGRHANVFISWITLKL